MCGLIQTSKWRTLDYKFNKRAVQVQTTIHLDQQLLKKGFHVHSILNSEYEGAVTTNEIKKWC